MGGGVLGGAIGVGHDPAYALAVLGEHFVGPHFRLSGNRHFRGSEAEGVRVKVDRFIHVRDIKLVPNKGRTFEEGMFICCWG